MFKIYLAIIMLAIFCGCSSLKTRCVQWEGKHCVAEELIFIKRNPRE